MVLVSHDHSFIYLKTRKVAGTSIEMALEPFCMPPGHVATAITEPTVTSHGIVGGRLHRPRKRTLTDRLLRRSPWYNHIPAAIVRRRLPGRMWRSYARISAIRNPFDRMVSYFYWQVKAPDRDDDFAALKGQFARFVRNGRWHDDHDVTHDGGDYVIDHMMRYEHLADDLDALRQTLSLPVEALMLPVTKSRKQQRGAIPVGEYFDSETADIVRTRMAWVFDRFGYSDDPRDAGAPAAGVAVEGALS